MEARFDKKKKTILLDLDETLYHLESVKHDIGLGFINGEYDISSFEFSIKGKKSKKIAILRPFIWPFFEFLFENFNVGIWTNSVTQLAKCAVHTLFTKEELNKFICVISRKELSLKASSSSFTYYDYLNKKQFKINKDGNLVKSLDIFFSIPFYGKYLNKTNTILIDDSDANYAVNLGKNVIHVSRFRFMNTCDDELKKIKNWLSRNVLNKRSKGHKDISKLKMLKFNIANEEITHNTTHRQSDAYARDLIEKHCKEKQKKDAQEKAKAKTQQKAKVNKANKKSAKKIANKKKKGNTK
jgi:hypothetical protein